MSIIYAGSYSVEFFEDVTDRGNQSGTFEHGSSGITQTIRIAFDDLQQAVIDILGSQTVAGGALTRIAPLQHGLFPAYYATKVSYLGGYKADGKFVTSSGNDQAQFDFVFLQIQYNTLPFSVGFSSPFAKGTAAQEFYRYVSKIPQPGVEFLKIAVTGAQYEYISNVFPPNQIPIPFGTSVRLQKSTLQYKWWWVPESFIFNIYGIPTNIVDGVGCVNDAVFPPNAATGFQPETLLCLPPQFEAINSPDPELAGLFGGPNREYNVTFNFLYFDPPNNPADNPAGHNSVPFNDGLFYRAVTQDGQNPLYPPYDFSKFFQGL